MALPITQKYIGSSSNSYETLVTVVGILGTLFILSRLISLP